MFAPARHPRSGSDACPRVSCIMPAYNYGSFIAGAIESVLAQDYDGEVEVVVVDDGSTDGTPEAVRPYLDRIRYVRQENAGINSAVNRALAEATGELIAFLDADDTWPPDKLSRQVPLFAERPQMGLLYGDLEVIDAAGNVTHPSFWAANNLQPQRGRLFGALLGRNFITGGSMMVRATHKGLFHPMPEVAAWVDWWIALRVAPVADIDFVREPVYRYRLHGENQNFGASGPRLAKALRRELAFRRWLMAGMAPGCADATDLANSVAKLDEVLRVLQATAGTLLEDEVDVDAESRASCHAALAAAVVAEDPDEAARLCVVALGHDPLSPDARPVLAGVRSERPADVRGFVTLAFADELVEEPQLLARYGRAFSAADDATLLIALPDPGGDALLGGLHEAVSAAGLAGEATADLLARPLSEPARVAPHVHAVLTNRPLTPALAARPAVDGADQGQLRSLAESRWTVVPS